jgi:hypothetical protein
MGGGLTGSLLAAVGLGSARPAAGATPREVCLQDCARDQGSGRRQCDQQKTDDLNRAVAALRECRAGCAAIGQPPHCLTFCSTQYANAVRSANELQTRCTVAVAASYKTCTGACFAFVSRNDPLPGTAPPRCNSAGLEACNQRFQQCLNESARYCDELKLIDPPAFGRCAEQEFARCVFGLDSCRRTFDCPAHRGLACTNDLCCPVGSVGLNGACVSTCSPACGGATPACCDGACTDVRDDNNNCGGCGGTCVDSTCCAGLCWVCGEFNVCCDQATQSPFCC